MPKLITVLLNLLKKKLTKKNQNVKQKEIL